VRFPSFRFISSPVKQLVIDLGGLPEGGKQLTGALAPDIFELGGADARPLGPLEFDLHAQQLENELLLMGRLQAPFEFECVRTLQRFKMTIRAENAAIALEIGNLGEIDVTEALREELLLAFPSYPRCDEGDDPMPCELNPQYLAVDKPVAGDVENPPDPHGDSRWAALDQLETPESEP
jgi:uncharacterized metal-binding protein YceD (DUF177 family)